MAQSKCPSCPNKSFELTKAPIANCNYSYCFIQCSACGAVVGVIPEIDTNFLIEKFAKRKGVEL